MAGIWRAMEDAMDADPFLDDSEEPLFADDLDEDDDIPAPPSPVNQQEIRRRVRLQAANNSSHSANNSRASASGSPSWPDGQGGENTTAVVDPDGTEQPVPIKKKRPVLTLGPDRCVFFECYSFHRLFTIIVFCYCCYHLICCYLVDV